jgi:4-amino-4-deoxy-L-arabinose transferase-like glycosyltransferase
VHTANHKGKSADRDLRSAHRTAPPRSRDARLEILLLLLTLLVALYLRVHRLDKIPAGVDYDEAGNYILAQEIATGQSHPVFIRAYAGREAVFYWLAAASMGLLGRTLFAFRLTAALCGVGTVLYTYLLAREMFHDQGELERRWMPPIGAALIAVSYWHVHVSRYGFRVNAMTLFLAATMTYLWRGLRRGPSRGTFRGWLDLAVAGILCGLSANTYLAIRAFPLVLLPFALWVILTWKPQGTPSAQAASSPGWWDAVRSSWRWLCVRQIALFAGAALLALTPLAVFYVQNPGFFGARMSQTSILDPEIHGGDLWGTLGEVSMDALGIFTVAGDSNPVYNYDRRPIYGPVLGACFYIGLLTCLWRAFRRRPHYGQTPYLLLLVWLPVMLLPNILGARGVPHSLRSMGMVPAVYYVAALGLLAVIRALGWACERVRRSSLPPGDGRMASLGGVVAVVVLLAAGGAQTAHWYFDLWTRDAQAYYRSATGVRLAAEYLGSWNADEVTLFASNDTYRHTTIAAFSANYEQLKWISGPTLVLPVESERPTLYVFDHTNPPDPVLARYLPADTLQHRELGPDGDLSFEAYLVRPDQMLTPVPQVPVQANLGDVIGLVGYDINAPAVSGDVLDVTLYWRVLRDGDRDDFTFFAHLVDDLGFRWGGETFFHYPSRQWQRGEIVAFRKRLAIAPGAPPGQYALEAGVFSPSLDARLPLLNENGGMAGTTIHLDGFDMRRADRPPDELPPIQQPARATYGSGLTLLGHDRDRGDLRPGESLALSLYWQAEARVEPGTTLSMWLEGAGGRIPLWEGDPVHGRYPFSQWQPPEFVRDRYALRLPTDAGAGDYDLRLALLRADGTPLPTSDGHDALSLSAIHVHATDRLWEPPEGIRPVGARLGERVELLGYDLEREEVRAGETLHLTLVWRCLREMDTSYTVFTHLLDEGEQMRGQQDNPPLAGRYPTTLWVTGEVVVDRYDIEVQVDAPPGKYAIEVGMYDPANVQRLAVLDPTGAVGDRVLLGKVQIRK